MVFVGFGLLSDCFSIPRFLYISKMKVIIAYDIFARHSGKEVEERSAEIVEFLTGWVANSRK